MKIKQAPFRKTKRYFKYWYRYVSKLAPNSIKREFDIDYKDRIRDFFESLWYLIAPVVNTVIIVTLCYTPLSFLMATLIMKDKIKTFWDIKKRRRLIFEHYLRKMEDALSDE